MELVRGLWEVRREGGRVMYENVDTFSMFMNESVSEVIGVRKAI